MLSRIILDHPERERQDPQNLLKNPAKLLKISDLWMMATMSVWFAVQPITYLRGMLMLVTKTKRTARYQARKRGEPPNASSTAKPMPRGSNGVVKTASIVKRTFPDPQNASMLRQNPMMMTVRMKDSRPIKGILISISE
jgi:hypothetical protein